MSVKKPVHTCVCVCACGWREGWSTALCFLLHGIQNPRVWTACGVQVLPTAHKHSHWCLPCWQQSGRLQPACPHAVLSADTLSQLVNMFCRGNSQGKQLYIFISLVTFSGWHAEWERYVCSITMLLILDSAKTEYVVVDLASLQAGFLPLLSSNT